jgi:hypothetical protein
VLLPRGIQGDSHHDVKERISMCIAILMAMSTKLEHRERNTTISENSFAEIYNGMNREAIRTKWRAFIREIWAQAVPFDDAHQKVQPIIHKNETQTLLHAQTILATTIYEVIFCDILKQKEFNNLQSWFAEHNMVVLSKNIYEHFYQSIPSPHGERFFLIVLFMF